MQYTVDNLARRFVSVSDLYEPIDPTGADKAFISNSMDATTHFESCGEDILSLYRRIMGKDYDYDAVCPRLSEHTHPTAYPDGKKCLNVIQRAIINAAESGTGAYTIVSKEGAKISRKLACLKVRGN